MTTAAASARRASRGRAMAGAARFGLAARAFVYVIIGWLAIEIALGRSSHQANQHGALAEVAQQSFGVALLWVLALGFASYALWRLSEAAFGTAAEGRKAGPRARSLVRGVVYAVLCATTVSFIAGRTQQGQSQQQESVTARLMRHTLGRWLVVLIGLIVIAVGVGMVLEGLTKKFERQLRVHEMSRTTEGVIRRLGVFGTVARGVAFALTGALTVDAAVTFDPGKSAGLDGALRTLAGRTYGTWLLGVVALGLIAFGLYGFAAARWAKT